MAEIILGVSGSIAAFKAVDLTSKLSQRGHAVHVILTAAAARLIDPNSFAYLARQRVHTELFDPGRAQNIEHIALTDRAELFLIAPATADLLGLLAQGLAPDFLSTAALAARGPLLICPAMNPRMWANPAVQANVERLRAFGHHVLTPDSGPMACGHVGPGRLVEPLEIAAVAERLIETGRFETPRRFAEDLDPAADEPPMVEAEAVEGERAFREEQRAAGLLVDGGFFDDDPLRGGRFLRRAFNLDEARSQAAASPLVLAGALACRVEPLSG